MYYVQFQNEIKLQVDAKCNAHLKLTIKLPKNDNYLWAKNAPNSLGSCCTSNNYLAQKILAFN